MRTVVDVRPSLTTNSNRVQRSYTFEQFGIFCYKVLAWLFLGAIVGSFIAQIQGFMPTWFIAVHILGAIGVAWLFVMLFLRYTGRKHARAMAPGLGARAHRAAPARIDSVQFGGIRMLETHELTIIQVTVFPTTEEPYQTTVRQFITADEAGRLKEGAMITFYEDPHDRGYGRVSPTSPAGQIRPDAGTFLADRVYPERRKTGLWLLMGRNPSVLARSVSFILIFALFGAGFLSPYIITGNVDWLRLKARYFPQRLVFQYKGNFNQEAFRKAYDKAVDYIGDRRIESLLFYKDFTAVKAEETGKPGQLEHATIRGNAVETHFMPSAPDDPDRLFTLASVRYETLQKALDDVGKDHDIQDVMYIGFRNATRWGMPVPGRRRFVDIHIVFEGGETSFHYDGQTGERLPD